MRYAIDLVDMLKDEAHAIVKRHNGTCAIDSVGNFVGLFDDQDDAGLAQQDVFDSVELKNRGIWRPGRWNK